MRLLKQLLICLVILVVGVGLWLRLSPGAGTTLAAIGISHPLIDAIAAKPAGDSASAQGTVQGAGQRSGQGQGGQGGGRNAARNVVTAPSTVAVINDRLNAIGNGEAIRSVTVTPSATGNLTDVLVNSGDRIEKGQVIARLDSDDQTIAAEQARLTRDSAREKVDRYRNLGSAAAVTAVEVRDAEIALQASELALRTAELDLKRRDVIAPLSGIVGIISVNPGDYVTTSTAIATVDDRSEILVDFWVPERFSNSMVVGKEVSATAIAEPGRALSGVIHAVDNRVDQTSRTLRVRARIENPDDRLRAGMSFAVTVTFDGDSYPAVDPLAIQWSADGSFVWRVTQGKSEKVPVHIIQRNPDKVLVDAKLAEGDTIVTEGLQQLRDGGAVKIAGQDAGKDSGKGGGDSVQPVAGIKAAEAAQ